MPSMQATPDVWNAPTEGAISWNRCRFPRRNFGRRRHRSLCTSHQSETADIEASLQKTEHSSSFNSSLPSTPSTPILPSQSITTENGNIAPASSPAASTASTPGQAPAPIVPGVATGDPARDWALKYERTENGPEADLVVRTGDINNLGFGWPQGFDPFSGNSTPFHKYPWNRDPTNLTAPIAFSSGSAVDPTEALRDIRHYNSYSSDGYSGVLSYCEMLSPNQICKPRPVTPRPSLSV